MIDCGLVGAKLGHSFSKELHGIIAKYDYALYEMSEDELIKHLKERDFNGFNITIPYKEVVINHLDELTDNARLAGCVNVIKNNKGILIGDNTDISGLERLLEYNKIDIKDKNVLILGNGGTSKTAKALCTKLEASKINILARNPKSGEIHSGDIYNTCTDSQIIINTTSVGMYPDSDKIPFDLDLSKFANLEAVVDVIYNPLNTMLVRNAKSIGVKATGGLYMLISQAILTAERFTGKQYKDKYYNKIYNKILRAKENVVIIGMPGCGKTTVGKIVARKLKKNFVDVDKLIEEYEGITIPKIFETKGEKYFRDLESKIINKISKEHNQVISTGGGAILREENMDNLKSNGEIFFYDRKIESYRISPHRPLMKTKEDLLKLYNERYDLYVKYADHIISHSSTALVGAKKIEGEFLSETTNN